MKQLEQWRPIPGYIGYEISRWGEIRSWHQKYKKELATEPHIVRNHKDSCGANHATICNDHKRKQYRLVITLMALTWFPDKVKEGLKPYHINGIKDDDRIDNIGFASPQETNRIISTIQNGNRRPVVRLDKAGNVVKIYPSLQAAADDSYMCYQSMLDHCKNRLKNPYKADGYNYQYEDKLHLERSEADA